MKQPILNRRVFVNGTLAIGTTSTLAACGGGEETDVAVEEGRATASKLTRAGTPPPAPAPGTGKVRAPVPVPAPVPAPAPAPSPAPQPGTPITTLRVTAAQVGTFPYSATVLPLPGQVPQVSTLVSPDDGGLRASVLSRWADGSAAVMVVAGTANIMGTGDHMVRLQIGNSVAGETALTADRVGQLVSSVKLDFGALGVAQISNFGNPERIWWANAQTICARYRLSVQGHATLEAVIDIQAFAAGRALVEVVVENAKLSSGAPVKPGSASYSALFSVNGTAVSTISASGAPEGNHAAFRAWYASYWVGGNAQLRATQSHTDLQNHPLFFKCDRGGGDMSVYASDNYTPWGAARQRGGTMGAAGDHPSIGPLPQWEARFLQSGDPRAARAVETSALAVLGFNVNYRDSATGLVPTLAQVAGRSIQSNWPVTYGPSDALTWKVSHHPAAGLMAFVTRPSPIFIEIAQKVALWNGTWSTWGGTPTGVFGRPYQMRGKAWCLRSLAHAVFLSPDSLAWKAAGIASLADNIAHLTEFKNDPRAKLNTFYESMPALLEPTFPAVPGYAIALWQHHYLVTELHKLASAKLLAGASQTRATELADWAAAQPVRWINEQSNGGWRYIQYGNAIGRNSSTIDSLPTWGEQMGWKMTDQPPAVAGTWMASSSEGAGLYSVFQGDGNSGAYYPSYFWAALVAAVDRNVPGATEAWAKVNTQVTNLATWREGFGSDPRWGSTPLRSTGFGVGQPAAPVPGPVSSDSWTPVRDLNGVVTQASWDSVPKSRWVSVVGTRLDALESVVRAAVPGFRDWGVEGWTGVTSAWNGMAVDTAGSRMWLMGGGHAASSNNGIYRFDALKMAWAVEQMPSDPTPWTQNYRETGLRGQSFGVCLESNAVMEARRAAGTLNVANDIYFDELLWDGQPTSRHTYSSMVFAPESNELVMISSRLWRYSLTERRWVYKRLIRDTPNRWLDIENGVSFYDSVKREVLTSSAGSTGMYNATGYSLTENKWTPWVSPWNLFFNVADTQVGRKLFVVRPPQRRSSYAATTGAYWEYDLDSRSVSKSGELQFSEGLSQNDFAPDTWFYDSAALTYIPSANRFWLYTLMADSKMALIEIDPTTTPWTARRLVTEGNVPQPGRNMERKLIYLPTLNAVMLCDTATKDWSLYRF